MPHPIPTRPTWMHPLLQQRASGHSFLLLPSYPLRPFSDIERACSTQLGMTWMTKRFKFSRGSSKQWGMKSVGECPRLIGFWWVNSEVWFGFLEGVYWDWAQGVFSSSSLIHIHFGGFSHFPLSFPTCSLGSPPKWTNCIQVLTPSSTFREEPNKDNFENSCTVLAPLVLTAVRAWRPRSRKSQRILSALEGSPSKAWEF